MIETPYSGVIKDILKFVMTLYIGGEKKYNVFLFFHVRV